MQSDGKVWRTPLIIICIPRYVLRDHYYRYTHADKEVHCISIRIRIRVSIVVRILGKSTNKINRLTDFPEAPVSDRQSHYNSRLIAAKTLSVPVFRTCSYQNCFFPLVITIWNQLPNELRNCDSLNYFKHQLSKCTL